MSVGQAVLNLLFPPKCPFCGRVTPGPGFCDACRRTLPWTEEGSQVQTLPGGIPCASPLWYEGPVRQGMLRFKFAGASGAAETLGGLIARCAAERFSGEFDTVTWVPVSARRLRRRGFDQAELLARSACRAWDTRPESLLRKTVDNPAQSGLAGGAAERRANVLGVYEPVHSMLAVWICRHGVGNTFWNTYVLIGAGIYLILLVLIALATRGAEKNGGKTGKFRVLPADADPLPIYAACGISAAAVALSLLSTVVAYYTMLPLEKP